MFVIGGLVVIAQHCPQTMRSGHLAQQAGAWLSGERGFSIVSNEWGRNEISGEHNQIGTEIVDHGDRGVQWVDRKIRVVMEIAEQRDGESIHALRPARQEKVLAHNARAVRFEQDGIPGKRYRASGSSRAEKPASCGRERRHKNLGLRATAATPTSSIARFQRKKNLPKT